MSAFAHLYKTARWRRLRKAQLDAHPLCAMHQQRGMIVAATICDHVERHGGDEVKFFAGPFQSLCKECHDSDKQSIERGGDRHLRGTAVDGWPIHRQRETGGEVLGNRTTRPRTAVGLSPAKVHQKTLPVL